MLRRIWILGTIWVLALFPPSNARAGANVLAFYYGWYGTPAVSGGWRHWKDVDAANERIADAAHYPAGGAYDSHDPAVLERHAAVAKASGITGFIASWWGRDSFEDHGLAPLLDAAGRHGLAVSAYYEKVGAAEGADKVAAAVADLDYLLSRYAGHKAWLRAEGKPVVFVYGRAISAMLPEQWREAIAQLRRTHPEGVVLLADTAKPEMLAVFDGAAPYNITGQTRHKSPSEIRAWAQAAYPRMKALSGAGKVSAVTVIPGYDDSITGRPRPRPVTQRWGGDTYRALWQEAIAAAPDYVLITSWNEWHEGSEIEPSVEYGSRLLEDTAVYSREFLARRK